MLRTIFATLLAVALSAPLADAAVLLDPQRIPPRTQATLRYANGATVSTANSHESRPALSLSKLYLGMWVLQHGAPEDKARVEDMIRTSNDATASDLNRKYPQAIAEIIRGYGLGETRYSGYWGTVTTSTEDVARFIQAVWNDPVAGPLMVGMRTASPSAADGYLQDFGTARIPGVEGTKFGWADDGSINATVSVGPGFSIAANTYGSPAELTSDILGAVTVVPPLPTWQQQLCAEVNARLEQVGSSRVC